MRLATLLNSNRNSVSRALNTVDKFGNLSGLRLTRRKPKLCGLVLGDIVTKHPLDSSGLKSLSEYLDLMYLTMQSKMKNLILRQNGRKCKVSLMPGIVSPAQLSNLITWTKTTY